MLPTLSRGRLAAGAVIAAAVAASIAVPAPSQSATAPHVKPASHGAYRPDLRDRGGRLVVPHRDAR
jgi:hypothetical protein